MFGVYLEYIAVVSKTVTVDFFLAFRCDFCLFCGIILVRFCVRWPKGAEGCAKHGAKRTPKDTDSEL